MHRFCTVYTTKQRVKRKKESSELIETIDGNPIFTADDFEDDRITKLLQQKQNSQFDDEEQDIFLTDLLSSDLNGDDDDIDDNDNEAEEGEHEEMLQNIFGSQSVKEPIIMGSQFNANPMALLSDKNAEHQTESERISMGQMLNSLTVPLSKSAAKQLGHFDDSQEVQRLKLTVESKINSLNVEVSHFFHFSLSQSN